MDGLSSVCSDFIGDDMLMVLSYGVHLWELWGVPFLRGLWPAMKRPTHDVAGGGGGRSTRSGEVLGCKVVLCPIAHVVCTLVLVGLDCRNL